MARDDCINNIRVAVVKCKRIEVAGRPTPALIGALVNAAVSFSEDRVRTPRTNRYFPNIDGMQALIGGGPTRGATGALEYAIATNIDDARITGINCQRTAAEIGEAAVGRTPALAAISALEDTVAAGIDYVRIGRINRQHRDRTAQKGLAPNPPIASAFYYNTATAVV